MSSCYISINQNIDDLSKECVEKIDIQNELKEILDKILNSIGLDKNLIESCSSIILNCLEKDDENENNDKEEINENKDDILDINSQLEITRSDSDSSFCEVINNYISEQSFDILLPENEDKKLFNFGKISPVLHEEIISLKEENDNNLDFIKNVKNIKEKRINIDILDEANLVLLNQKRYGPKNILE